MVGRDRDLDVGPDRGEDPDPDGEARAPEDVAVLRGGLAPTGDRVRAAEDEAGPVEDPGPRVRIKAIADPSRDLAPGNTLLDRGIRVPLHLLNITR